MNSIKTGVQLYSVRHELKRDPLKTLYRVKEMGYEGVEFFGNPEYQPEQIKSWLNETGLEICGWHTPFDNLLPDAFERTADFNCEIGNTRLIVPSLPGRFTKTIDGWIEAAHEISGFAAKLSERGMKTGYHNHSAEFKLLEGQFPWDAFFMAASPDVFMQLDTGNAMSAGAHVDIAATLRAYPGRSDSIHLKPFKHGVQDGFAVMMGADSQPYGDIHALCKADITQWFIVEFEHESFREPMAGIAECAAELRKLGF